MYAVRDLDTNDWWKVANPYGVMIIELFLDEFEAQGVAEESMFITNFEVVPVTISKEKAE